AFREEAATSRAHARHFLELVEAAEGQFVGPAEAEWLARLHPEHDNLRAALAWDIAHGEVEWASRTAGALANYWQLHGYWSEGRRWLDEALAADQAAAGTATRAKALLGAGLLARYQGDPAAARRSLEASAAIYH